MNSYREFWIELENTPNGLPIAYSEKVDGLDENAIHVIQYDVYETLQAKLLLAIKDLKNHHKVYSLVSGKCSSKCIFICETLAELKKE